MSWQGNKEELAKTAYVYYQGRDSAQLQALKCLGNQAMIATTGEIAYFDHNCISTIPRENLWAYPEIQEINRQSGGTLSQVKHRFRGIKLKPMLSSFLSTYHSLLSHQKKTLRSLMTTV